MAGAPLTGYNVSLSCLSSALVWAGLLSTGVTI